MVLPKLIVDLTRDNKNKVCEKCGLPLFYYPEWGKWICTSWKSMEGGCKTNLENNNANREGTENF